LKKNSKEQRSIVQEFRVSEPDQPATIQGYAAVFDSPADGYWFREELDPHCFDAVLATNPDVRALWNHNPDHVLGRTAAGTLSLAVDARGLSYTIEPPDTQTARDLIVSMRRKDVTGSSFGFVVARDQWTDNPDGTITRRILEIEELIDVSPVTYPFYDTAGAQVRSLPESMPAEMRSRIEQRDAKPDSLQQHEDDWRANMELRLRLAEQL
jgi:HK97 family phage prohead protease